MAGVNSLPATTERSAPVAGPFAPGPNLNVPRWFHRATRLLDGRVLVTGGVGAGGTALASAEVFSDPALSGSPAPGSPVDSFVQISPTRYTPHLGPNPITFDLWVSGDAPTGSVAVLQADGITPLPGCASVALNAIDSHGSCTPVPNLSYGDYTLFLSYTPADGRNKPSFWPFNLSVSDWASTSPELVPNTDPHAGVPVTLRATTTYWNPWTLLSDGVPVTTGTVSFAIWNGSAYAPIATCQNLVPDGSGITDCSYTFTVTGTTQFQVSYTDLTGRIRNAQGEAVVNVVP
jgi:hypothetical protein